MPSATTEEKPGLAGTCDARFAKLRDLFEVMLNDGREVGAAVALYAEGKPVVDLWGGWADPDALRPWQYDTIVSTFSVSKAVVSTMGHMLIDRGEIDLDAPVARYWPEFGQNGKEDLLVRYLFDHRCAICYVDRALAPGELYDWDLMIKAVEQTAPNWPYGEHPVYLNMTYGYLLGGLIYKVTGKRIGQFMREELGGALGLDFNFALTPDEKSRCARVMRKKSLLDEVEAEPGTLLARTMQGFAEGEDFNSEGWRSNEVGAGQGHGNARAIARLFAMLGNGGALDGVRIMRQATRDQAIAFQCESDGTDPLFDIPIRFALGYELNCPPFPMGPNARAFGHWGAGGSFGFADPDAGVSFGYTPNFMHDGLELGPRGAALVNAVFDCL